MLTKRYTIHCDFDCERYISVTTDANTADGPGRVRREANENGWCRRGGLDACIHHHDKLPAAPEPLNVVRRPFPEIREG